MAARRRARIAVLPAALLSLALITGPALSAGAAETAVPPADFIAMKDTLSQPDFPEIVTEAMQVPMSDGETLYVELTRPNPQTYGEQKLPVILEASPYHGTIASRIGDRMFPDAKDADGKPLGLTGYFAPRGYNVLMVDLRGTGRSTGCLDQLGPKDAKDLKTIVEWAADQSWSSGKVGMTGHSYVGSTPIVAAAQNPRGLATIVPSAGLASMYDHQFQKGVPYNLQYIGPMVAYESLALNRDLPSAVPMQSVPAVGSPAGDNFGYAGPNAQTGCGVPNSAALAGSGQVTGQYENWHAKRDWRTAAADADIPVFMIHGANDNAARIPAAEWFFANRFNRPGDKVWLGQWDHGSTNGRCGDVNNQRVTHPTCRFSQFQYALQAWFDKHLKGMDVDTGPAVEAFLNGAEPVDVAAVMDPEVVDGKVYTANGWSRPAARRSLYLDATNRSLSFEPPTQSGSATFGTAASAILAHLGATKATFTSEPLAEDTVFVGMPKMNLNAAVSNPVSQVTVTLWRVDEAGQREIMNVCAVAPLVRDNVATVSPVVPGQEMEMATQCFTMAQWVPAGQSLVAEVATTSPHHATFGTNPQATVFTGPGKSTYTLPVVPDAVLHEDVPLREQ